MVPPHAVTFQHHGATFCDRAGVPLAKGMSVRVQHAVGAYGRTEVAEGAIEDVDMHGIQLTLHKELRRVGMDGGVRYLQPGDSVFLAVRFAHEPGRLIAAHEHTDVEHAHRTFVESVDGPANRAVAAADAAPSAPVAGFIAVAVDTRSAAFGDIGRDVECARLLRAAAEIVAVTDDLGALERTVLHDVNRVEAGAVAFSATVPRTEATEEDILRAVVRIRGDADDVARTLHVIADQVSAGNHVFAIRDDETTVLLARCELRVADCEAISAPREHEGAEL